MAYGGAIASPATGKDGPTRPIGLGLTVGLGSVGARSTVLGDVSPVGTSGRILAPGPT